MIQVSRVVARAPGETGCSLSPGSKTRQAQTLVKTKGLSGQTCPSSQRGRALMFKLLAFVFKPLAGPNGNLGNFGVEPGPPVKTEGPVGPDRPSPWPEPGAHPWAW